MIDAINADFLQWFQPGCFRSNFSQSGNNFLTIEKIYLMFLYIFSQS